MIIYESTKAQFRNDVKANKVDTFIAGAFKAQMGFGTSKNELRSWQNSLMYMSNVLDDNEIPDAAGIFIEYNLPRSSKRIDFIITGQDEQKKNSIVIVELKQWQNLELTELPDVVKTFVGGASREQTHPSYQALSYAQYLEDLSEVISRESIGLYPCSYLHNCESESVARHSFYQNTLEQSPAFLRDDAGKLTSFIKKHIRHGDAQRLMYKIEHGEIRPTKKLAEAFSKMLKGKREFVMIDDQKIVYEKAFQLATTSSATSKNVLIIHGGPGTGKSVVAVNRLVRLIERQLNAQYVSKNSAPREVYSSKLTGVMSQSRFKSLFVGSGSFTTTDQNTFDALVVDEAHRLNQFSGMYSNLGENQVKEIIESAKFSVFFLDEDQKVALSDIGTSDEIRKWAAREGAMISELRLTSQFRCNGSDGYLNWLDHSLGIRETANTNIRELDYDFNVFDSAKDLHDQIVKHDRAGKPSRTVAGYCWDWKSSSDPKAYDIELGKLKMQWNLKAHGSAWIIHPNSLSEAGCIHTCQGLEVDYIGVIVGPDLLVRNGSVVTNGLARPGRDKTVKGFRKLLKNDKALAEKLVDRIIKNTYKTLMTRGMKGCYIHCTDPETNDYFKSLLGMKHES